MAGDQSSPITVPFREQCLNRTRAGIERYLSAGGIRLSHTLTLWSKGNHGDGERRNRGRVINFIIFSAHESFRPESAESSKQTRNEIFHNRRRRYTGWRRLGTRSGFTILLRRWFPLKFWCREYVTHIPTEFSAARFDCFFTTETKVKKNSVLPQPTAISSGGRFLRCRQT